MATATHDEQLSWERRLAPYAAVAAFGSVVFQFAATAVQIPALQDAPSRDEDKRYRESLLSFHDHAGNILASSLVTGLAAALAAGALFYLFRVTRSRRPELPGFLLWVLVAAPVFMIVAAVINHANLQDISDRFLESGPRTNARAKQLIDDNRSSVAGGLGLAGSLALALSYVLISLNAMRVGLLSRFMGILGCIVGVLIVLPLLPSPIPVVQVFWLAALGFLVLDRWPGGRGPAWETGEPEPWPTPQRRASVAAGERGEPPRPPEPGPEAEAGSERPRRQRSSRKRKKKQS
jgi:hypothetical protein